MLEVCPTYTNTSA